MSINKRKNNDNIFTRSIIAGLLNLFNNVIKYDQIGCGESVEEISLPWYYNKSGDQRFMQDFFTDYDYCFKEKDLMKIPGNMDMIPMGIITYAGATIDSNRLTSRFVRGTFTKNVNGKTISYNSYLLSIPLTMRFDCEVKCDSYTKALEIEEKLRDELYKTKTFYVSYKNLRIPSQMGFPDTDNLEKLMSYTHETDHNHVKITFQIEVETYQPSFDKTVERMNMDYIKSVGYRMSLGDPSPDGRSITLTTFNKPTKIPYDSTSLIEWNYKQSNILMHFVDIYYIKADGKEVLIDKNVPNQMYYMLNFGQELIPRDISYNILFDDNVSKDIKVLLDIDSHGYINENSFIYQPDENTSIFNIESGNIPITIEYKNSKGDVKVTNNGDIHVVVKNYAIDHFIINDPRKKIKLFAESEVSKVDIRIKIVDSSDKNVYAISENIEII